MGCFVAALLAMTAWARLAMTSAAHTVASITFVVSLPKMSITLTAMA